MARFIRTALATVCFAASVGCLGLWGRSMFGREIFVGPNASPTDRGLQIEFSDGEAFVAVVKEGPPTFIRCQHISDEFSVDKLLMLRLLRRGRMFHRGDKFIIFPLWYPALIFGLAGVAALRLGRRFTLRSAIIATTVVAGLLGMAVGL